MNIETQSTAKQRIHNIFVEFIASSLKANAGNLYFYYFFYQKVKIVESKDIPTACVYFKHVYFYMAYNPEYVESISDAELKSLLVHEVFHILENHLNRIPSTEGYAPKIWNIATDSYINESIIDNYSKIGFEINDSWVRIDSNYKGEMLSEDIYNFLYKKFVEFKKESESKNNNSDSGNSIINSDKISEKIKIDKFTGEIFKQILNGGDGCTTDYHGFESDGEASDLEREVLNDILQQAKAMGYLPGNFEKYYEMTLKEKKSSHVKKMLRATNMLISYIKNDKSYLKLNRRVSALKGNLKNTNELFVLLDTSGSMSDDFEKVLSYVFKNDVIVRLVQSDTQVTSDDTLTSKKDLSKLNIKGLGGTELQPGINYCIQNKAKYLIILTDGYTDSLDLTGIKKTLIITSAINPPIKSGDCVIIKTDKV